MRPRAALSHHDAATPWGLLPSPTGHVHVSVPGTLIDVAPSLTPRALERAVDEAFFLRRVNVRTINAALARNANRPGVTAVRRCLERHEPGTTRTESEL